MEKKSRLPFFNRMKISNKLTLLYSSIVSLVLLIFVACTVLSVYIYGNIKSERILTSAASNIVNSITTKQDLLNKNWDDITVGKDLYVVIYSETGEILRKPSILPIDDDLIEDANLEIFNSVFRKQFFDDAAYINRIIMVENEVFIVQVIKDYRSEIYMIAFMSATLGVLMILGIISSVLIGHRLSRQMLKPIGTMTENANAIQRNAVTSERLEVTGSKDELYNLANTINAMLDRIENYSKTLNQFVSDASHELRTPITVVLAYAEMLKKWAKDDPKALEKSIINIEKEALGMKNLIERLLTLAKSDSNNLVLNREDFELDSLIYDVYEETKIIAGSKEIRLNDNTKLVINSDMERLKELLRIILDNAIKYTKEDGVIELSSTSLDSKLIITVKDNGMGIKEAEIDKIFDRFYSCEASRNKKRSGNGLGLSIAKALAEELGFEISAQSKEGQFTKFTLAKEIV